MKSSFQTILIIVFIVAFVAAIAVFSGLFSSPQTSTSTEPSGTVVIWGILPQAKMQPYLSSIDSQDLGYSIDYQEHSSDTFAQDLTNALADSNPPDMVIFSSELFSQFKDKLYTIPYAAYPERTYRDTHVDGAQIFLSEEGVVALPLLVDPLTVYYNKDILAAANFVIPPKTWNDLTRAIPSLTKRDARSTIIQATLPFGEFQNVLHFRDILSTLFLQSGNQIVAYDKQLGRDEVVLATSSVSDAISDLPTAQALMFYTNFSNPTSTTYTWNRGLPSSLDMFLSGKSAFYIGRASELFTIQAQNPNLNFDVMQMFQSENAVRPVTFGSFIGAAVLRNAPNFPAAYSYLGNLGSMTTIDTLSKQFSLPPVRRDLLLVQQSNPYVSVFFKAALSSFAWPDPNPSATEVVFRAMITDVTSGRRDAAGTIYEAAKDLQINIR